MNEYTALAEALNLLAISDEPEDTVSRHLVARQRELLRLLGGDNRRGLADLLATDFTWGPFLFTEGSGGEPASVGEPVGYIEVIAGAVPPGITEPPVSFHIAQRQDPFVVVVAGFGRLKPRISTVWRKTEAGWLAIRLTQLPPVGGTDERE